MKSTRFTLLEILMAIGLVVILAAITMGGMHYASSRSDEAATLATMKEFEMALEKFKAAKGYYPVVKSAAVIDLSQTAWQKFKQGGYLSGDFDDKIKDAYGNQLWYQCPGSHNKSSYDLWSMGEDEKHGDNDGSVAKAGEEGCDDICNWQQH